MEGSHGPDLKESPAFRRLEQFVTEARSRTVGDLGSFADFELAVRTQLVELGRELLAADRGRYDLRVSEIVADGVEYRQALRSKETYLSALGPVPPEPQLYCPRDGNGRAIARWRSVPGWSPASPTSMSGTT